jgi:hypothetical protein
VAGVAADVGEGDVVLGRQLIRVFLIPIDQVVSAVAMLRHHSPTEFGDGIGSK